jgi:phosphopantothenoylcysteine decarboxylase/phosphopantothenate--cysteine ligase
LKVLVTTGPSFEPIDEVRRLTNFSTGESGVRLANHFASRGYDVICLRGEAATYGGAPENCRHLPFTTNEDLLRHLTNLSHEHEVAAVFHVAALCDFKVKAVADAGGQRLASSKIESRAGNLSIELEPARKIIGELRGLFPRALLAGWKYELNGNRDDALEKAWRQLKENKTNVCVLNGRAYGSGFGFCTPPDGVRHIPTREELFQVLSDWLKSHRTPA